MSGLVFILIARTVKQKQMHDLADLKCREKDLHGLKCEPFPAEDQHVACSGSQAGSEPDPDNSAQLYGTVVSRVFLRTQGALSV